MIVELAHHWSYNSDGICGHRQSRALGVSEVPEHPPKEEGEEQSHGDLEDEPKPVPQQLAARHRWSMVIRRSCV